LKIAYVRVSTTEQNDSRQVEALERKGIDKWFMEKVSAKDTNRPELQAMLEFCREGDTIYIHDFSRLARSTKDLLEIVEKLKNKKVTLISNKENLDTSTPTGKLMLTMIGAINEFERENLLERQREGIAIAKEKGAYKNSGRKKIEYPANWKEVFEQWQKRLITSKGAMKELKLKNTSFYKLLNQYKKELEEK
jgi:DNA invertase Pin-like site-specific DNA recombinase